MLSLWGTKLCRRNKNWLSKGALNDGDGTDRLTIFYKLECVFCGLPNLVGRGSSDMVACIN